MFILVVYKNYVLCLYIDLLIFCTRVCSIEKLKHLLGKIYCFDLKRPDNVTEFNLLIYYWNGFDAVHKSLRFFFCNMRHEINNINLRTHVKAWGLATLWWVDNLKSRVLQRRTVLKRITALVICDNASWQRKISSKKDIWHWYMM